ncbi:MAG TPA: methionyl-tRNA formyltransferase [Chthoniobacteraceae bacterium]|nr:methionyl-tRNA formyltransferase [Chthoniobacteraceae bacterium]
MLRITFIGTGEIGVPALRWLLDAHEVVAAVTQPDKPVGRRQELHASAIKQLAAERGVPVLQPVKLRAPEAMAAIAALRADVIVVAAYGQLLPNAVLDAPRLACLNLHASILPKYRGASPIHAAIEAGERTTGVTVMHMAEGLDTGDILLVREIPIRRRETCGTLHDRLAILAADALADALPLVAAGNAPRIPQNDAEANYAPKLTRENGAIDWTASQLAIDRRIRAMNPWPAAHTWLTTPDGPRQLKVFSCIPHRCTRGPAAEVLRADERGLLVGAGEGAVLLRDVQLEGKRRMGAGEFLRGHPVAVGARLPSSSFSSSSSSSRGA